MTYPPRRVPLDLSMACVPWPGHRKPTGYATIVIAGQTHYVHRLSYQLHVGYVPRGWNVGHACHDAAVAAGTCGPGACEHRACWAPVHLVAQRSRENSAGGGHPLFVTARTGVCQRGHDLSLPENQSIRADGRIRCRPCQQGER